jgi:hypothetical protein
MWALPEFVEVVAPAGDAGLARDALGRLAKTTQPAGIGMETYAERVWTNRPQRRP